MKQKISEILKWLPVLLCCFLFVLVIYIFKWQFNDVSLTQMLYNLFNSKGVNIDVILSGLVFTLIGGGILLLIFLIPVLIPKDTFVYLKIKKRNFKIRILPIKRLLVYRLLIIIVLLFVSFDLINLEDYIKSYVLKSSIIEKNYVDPNETDLTFPEKKKNLIYIYLESMESINVSTKNNGIMEKSYIPNLEALALKNINFSNNNKIGGAYQVDSVSWTIAAMVAHTAGIPLKLTVAENSYSGYSSFLRGATSLGEMLEDNGYSNHLMIGSEAEFGGRDEYFSQHGNYEIIDYVYAEENGLIDEGYRVWWGYEDKRLYNFAQNKITELAKQDEPFNFTMLTADTHFVDGYLDEECETPFDNQYANVFHCADSMINDFLSWLSKQDFYDDTVVIVTGDHLTMQSEFYDVDSDYQRSVYNVFINSEVEPVQEKNRIFTTMDMFPTTLAAMGVEIDGDRLGLGTNLFSGKETLAEKYGIEYLNNELNKKSEFYDEKFLQDTYYELLETGISKSIK